MPPILKKQPMVLSCEWLNCDTVKSQMDSFLRHIDEHVDQILPDGVNAENYKHYKIELSEDELCCGWSGCNFSTTSGETSLVRHLYFHAYHTKIKWWAKQEQSKNNFGQCILGSVSRNIIPELPEGFCCYWKDCEFYTDNAEHFYRHADNHGMMDDGVVKKGTVMHVCSWEGCDSVTKTKYKLAEHLRSHTQEKKFACAECGSLFSNRTKFIDHITRQIALELQNYQCSHCSKIFASERLLRDHMRHHVNHYKCPDCDMTCTNPSMLKAHIKWKHTDDRPYHCNQCEHSCKSLSSLRKHQSTHNSPNLLVCDEPDCNYTAFSVPTMRKHLVRCHTSVARQPYICHVCPMRYSCGATLTRHLKVKHKFKWPSGHSRFRYKKQDDGLYRLQTVRYESLELTEQILKEKQQQQAEFASYTEEGTSGDVENNNSVLTMPMDLDTASECNIDELERRIEREASVASNIGMMLLKGSADCDGFQVTQDGDDVGMAEVVVTPQGVDLNAEAEIMPVCLVYE